MSVRIMSEVFARYPHDGGTGEKLLALALADHANDDGEHIFPAVARLATKTGQSERTVQYQLRRMQTRGWLMAVAHSRGGAGQTTHYQISPDWIKGADIAPLEKVKKGANDDIKGCKPEQKRVQSTTQKGATGCTRIIIEPSIEPSENHQRAREGKPESDSIAEIPTSVPPKKNNRSWQPPNWLNLEAWAEFEEHRKEIRQPLTNLGRKKAAATLQGLSYQEQASAIDLTIANRWRGIFPQKISRNGQSREVDTDEDFVQGVRELYDRQQAAGIKPFRPLETRSPE